MFDDRGFYECADRQQFLLYVVLGGPAFDAGFDTLDAFDASLDSAGTPPGADSR
ncbi:hypothetical protein [Streptomyces sp. XD-27]|uniref:hypothetical protein n=1 Tax=Streptomyces sp. XD-27 TaxID=3062779 RepID=UPI0026F41CE1|nr:hypothetical protein [Streptomyces sp. XD-27]WKX71077.1 hypothetical protein Q3Y56_15190 [Streptomyces sp. XD-27]